MPRQKIRGEGSVWIDGEEVTEMGRKETMVEDPLSLVW